MRHVEQFGPELVIETAASYLGSRELAELRGFVAHKERTSRRRHGRWEPRPERARRTCERCGAFDLPRNARANTRFHRHCQKADAQERYRRKRAQKPQDTGQVVFTITGAAENGLRTSRHPR